MKKNLFTVAAVALIAFVSCNKETNSPVQPAPVSDIKFEAEIAQTKTAIGKPDSEGNRDVTWVLGDKVNINGTLFTATGFKEDGKAIFETELDFTVAEQYDAIYPATAGTSLEAVTIASKQDGTFASAGVAVAQSENRSLAFMNVASLIKFQVPAAYASVTVESTANLAGTVSVTFAEDGTPVIGNVENASKVITLEKVEAGVDYYVAILPGDHKFTFNIDGRLSKEASMTLTAVRAGILSLGKLPKPAKLDRNLAFSAAEVVGYTSGWVQLPTLSGETSGVQYTSSDPEVASVDLATGKLTITEKKGTTTITASAPETDDYLAGSASYILTVNQSNVRIYIRLWPKINNWDKWRNDPYIYYWGDHKSADFPGHKLLYEKHDNQYDYYYEFEYSKSKKVNFIVSCNQGEQTYNVEGLTLDKNYYYSVYTEWHDGGLLTINQDSTTNP